MAMNTVYLNKIHANLSQNLLQIIFSANQPDWFLSVFVLSCSYFGDAGSLAIIVMESKFGVVENHFALTPLGKACSHPPPPIYGLNSMAD